ncbi:MAG: histidine kinase [Oscillospiraceae bacterium]|nr:histidine kinase [Oscillospiraceae bacterium]
MIRKFKTLHTLIKNSKFRISFLKYYIGSASIAIVALAIYGVVSYNLYSMYMQDTLSQYRERILYKTSGFVDYVFDGVDAAFYLINSLESFEKLLGASVSDFPEFWEVGEASGPEPPILRSDISRVISDLFRETILSPAMESIYIYMENSEYVVTWTDFRHLDTFFDASFMDGFNYDGNFVVRDIHLGPDTKRVITMYRTTGRADASTGVVAFNIDYYQFLSFVEQGFEHLPEMISVADSSGRVFCATDPDLLNTYLGNDPTYRDLFTEASLLGSSAAFVDDRFISAMQATSGQYMIISSVDASAIAEFRLNFLNFAIWASVIGLLASFFLAFGISFFMHRNIIRLVSYFSGYRGVGDNPDAGGEMKYITENIANMTSGDRHIENELAEKLAELKKAQAIALQNQINPHFILNTLQIVNLDILSQTKSDTPATRMIALLSEILKSNLNTTDHIVPLSYEIRQAVKFIEIEQIRNKNRFFVEWDIDDSLNDYRTVKFILQPVLENSFKHGFLDDSEKDKRISIKAEKEGKALVIMVRDNGTGITPEALAELRERLNQSFLQENTHIGLCNVDRRIKLVFGDAYGLSVTSDGDSGTIVTIKQKLVRTDWK